MGGPNTGASSGLDEGVEIFIPDSDIIPITTITVQTESSFRDIELDIKELYYDIAAMLAPGHYSGPSPKPSERNVLAEIIGLYVLEAIEEMDNF